MIAFVGLGNTGHEYSKTKHNAGFWVVDELARRWKINFQPGQGQYVFAEDKKRSFLLVKPIIGMNGSGIPVKDVVHRWGIDLSELFIILDDVDLPLVQKYPEQGWDMVKGYDQQKFLSSRATSAIVESLRQF